MLALADKPSNSVIHADWGIIYRVSRERESVSSFNGILVIPICQVFYDTVPLGVVSHLRHILKRPFHWLIHLRTPQAAVDVNPFVQSLKKAFFWVCLLLNNYIVICEHFLPSTTSMQRCRKQYTHKCSEVRWTYRCAFGFRWCDILSEWAIEWATGKWVNQGKGDL